MRKVLIIFFCFNMFFCFQSAFSESNNANEVGTYQLITAKGGEGGKEEKLYRINTKTGEVWVYTEVIVLDENQLSVSEKSKENFQKLIEQSKKQGKNVYTMPYWVLTDEKRPEFFTIH